MLPPTDPTWKDLVASIRSHRAHRARFFKPVCVISAIDLADERGRAAVGLDARAIENRFRRYVEVVHPTRSGQAWRPLWHLSVDGLWTFVRDGRELTAADFPDEKPGGRTQFLSSFDDMIVADRYVEPWLSPALRRQLRNEMLAMLAEDDETIRPFARQLADPAKAFRPDEWLPEEELPIRFGLPNSQPDLFGIEEERDPDVGRIGTPFDPETIQMDTKSLSVDLLLRRVARNMIDLQPDFQRRMGIWNERRQSRLIESMLLRIPLPVLYAAEDDEDRWEIVDGIQRLTSIAKFIRPRTVGAAPLRLTSLEYLREYDGLTFEQLSERLQLRLLETELVINVIRKQTPPEVKLNIFARINSGGVQLTNQELRHAITPGQAREFVRELASSEAFVTATDASVSPTRMADRELVLRFLAFRVLGSAGYRQSDMDGFLLNAMSLINELEDHELDDLRIEFIEAMGAATAIFGNDAFRKRHSGEDWRHPINKGLFETIAVNLAELGPRERELLIEEGARVRADLMTLCADRQFDAAITQGTSDVAKVRRRFHDVRQLFSEVIRAR